MNRLKKIAGLFVTKLAWIPTLLFMIFYVLVINVDKVHTELNDESEEA